MKPSTRDDLATRASLFLRLKAGDTQPREIAWEQFRHRYAPAIAGFARHFGAKEQDVDDIIQDVLLGFYAAAPKFVYDPAKGRFRAYLKAVTLNSIRRRLRERAKLDTVPLSEVADDAPAVQESWDRNWHDQLMRRALVILRDRFGGSEQTFEAFRLYVLQNQPPADVAHHLGMSVDSVYKAKQRILKSLRDTIQQLDEED